MLAVVNMSEQGEAKPLHLEVQGHIPVHAGTIVDQACQITLMMMTSHTSRCLLVCNGGGDTKSRTVIFKVLTGSNHRAKQCSSSGRRHATPSYLSLIHLSGMIKERGSEFAMQRSVHNSSCYPLLLITHPSFRA